MDSRIFNVGDLVADVSIENGRAFFIWMREDGKKLSQIQFAFGSGILVLSDLEGYGPISQEMTSHLVRLTNALLNSPESFDLSQKTVAFVSPGAPEHIQFTAVVTDKYLENIP